MDDIAVITPFLGFDKSPSKIEGFLKFKESIKEQGVPLYVIEIVPEGDSPRVEKFCKDDFYFKESVFIPMWLRENAINVLSSKVHEQYTKIIWMDCDTIVKEDNWINKASDLLEDYKLVKIGEAMSWGGFAAHRSFFESVGLFDFDFCGMGDYVSYLSATKEDLLGDEEELLNLYKDTNLEIYYKILSYRKKAFEYFNGSCTTFDAPVQKFLSNQNTLVPDSIELKKKKSLLLKFINIEQNIKYNGLHKLMGVKSMSDFSYPAILTEYLRTGEISVYNPSTLYSSGSLRKPHDKEVESIFKELKNLKLAQFEIMQRETDLVKLLENYNG